MCSRPASAASNRSAAAARLTATEFGSTLVRGFLFENALLADMAFTPVADFKAWAPVRVAFDRAGTVTGIAKDWLPWTPVPDWRGEAGFAAHHVLHACVAASRGRLWQSLFYLQRIRNRTLSLASERHGWDSSEFAHVDDLPPDERDVLLPSLVESLDQEALVEGVGAATDAFLAELRQRGCRARRSPGDAADDDGFGIPLRVGALARRPASRRAHRPSSRRSGG
jgi:hypothetical protein